MKGSKVTLIGVIAVGSMLLAWLSLTLLSGTSPTKTKAVTTDPYHCPSCGREYPRGARGECPFCRIEEGGETKKKYSSNPFTGERMAKKPFAVRS